MEPVSQSKFSKEVKSIEIWPKDQEIIDMFLFKNDSEGSSYGMYYITDRGIYLCKNVDSPD